MTMDGRRLRRATAAVTVGSCIAGAAVAADPAPERILRDRCGSCHLEEGRLQRIGNLRKSPEGWDMTIVRMGIWHKVEVPREERRVLVKYLSDRQGLAPSEAAPYRFLFEQVPNAQDVVPSDDLAQMCGRCHSFGRVGLQRRDTAEWGKLVHTHLGQFPSVEYSALGRDRNWKEIALAKSAPELGELYPLETDAWRQWKKRKWASPAGTWRVAGYRPGWGDYAGYMKVKSLGGDRFSVSYELDYAAGNRVTGTGESVVYTGYEWRGRATLGNQAVRSVYALSEDGRRLSGRWFLRDADEVGARMDAVRVDDQAKGHVLAVQPGMVRAGARARVTLQGVGVPDRFAGAPGIQVVAATRHSPDRVTLDLEIAPDAPEGWQTLAGAGSTARLAVYREIDSIRVEPAFGIARLGGGTNPPVSAQFEAIAYLDGPDGKPGTDDDVRLGQVPARWRADAFDERAREDRDLDYAGAIDPVDGLFMPAPAGPNPARKGLNNVGNLSVIATVADGARTLEASAQLMVTVQRWNKPPLR